jgi:hypothetical protein
MNPVTSIPRRFSFPQHNVGISAVIKIRVHAEDIRMAREFFDGTVKICVDEIVLPSGCVRMGVAPDLAVSFEAQRQQGVSET